MGDPKRHDKPQVQLVSQFVSSRWATACLDGLVGTGLLHAYAVGSSGTCSAFQADGTDEPAIKDCHGSDEGVACLIFGQNVAEIGADPGNKDHIEFRYLPPANHQSLKIDGFESPKYSNHSGVKIDCGAFVLLAKICGALSAMGYDYDTIRKVGHLVIRNAKSEVDAEVDELRGNGTNTPPVQSEAHQIKITIAKLLSEILFDKKCRSQLIINSNEPVLLINSLGGLNHDQIKEIVAETLLQLQSTYSIWPVRIYAGTFLAPAEPAERGNSPFLGFSLTILNVVNTEIGGPSMIQLLDEYCDAPAWKEISVREIWNGRELVARQEAPSKFANHHVKSIDDVSPANIVVSDKLVTSLDTEDHHATLDPVQEVPINPGSYEDSHANTDSCTVVPTNLTASGGREANEAPEKGFDEEQEYVENKQTDANTVALPDSSEQFEAVGKETSSASSILVEVESEPQSAPLDPMVNKPPVRHPTWDRAHDNESLLDMIRRQAGQELGTSSVADEALHEPSSEPTQLPGEDDYEVV